MDLDTRLIEAAKSFIALRFSTENSAGAAANINEYSSLNTTAGRLGRNALLCWMSVSLR